MGGFFVLFDVSMDIFHRKFILGKTCPMAIYQGKSVSYNRA